MNTCPTCGTSFEGRSNKVYCSERCRKKAEKKRHYEKHGYNKEYKRRHDLKNLYGITPDDYNRMFVEQKGCCAICGTHQQELKKKLAVDHDHETGKVRGLLCRSCNTGIGLLKENKEILLAAISYLGYTEI